MTYIVGGKLNNIPFLLIDCKAKNEDGSLTFYDKVVSFNSHKEEAYFCQMGNAYIKDLITMSDYIMTYEKRKIDVFDFKDILKLFDEINVAIQYSEIDYVSDYNSLFFISKSDVCKYNVYFDKDKKKFYNISQVKIESNKCITSNSILTRDVRTQVKDLKDFCKNVIEQEKMGVPDDLKDRYTFLTCDGNCLRYDFPYKSKYDIINMFTNMGFDKLQN